MLTFLLNGSMKRLVGNFKELWEIAATLLTAQGNELNLQDRDHKKKSSGVKTKWMITTASSKFINNVIVL